MLRSRVLTGIDPHRLGSAVSYPGIDPRIWVSYGVLTSEPYIETIQGEQDVFVDVLLLPSRQPETARVGSIYAGNGFGFYTPMHTNDEVLICAPSGDPDEGLVVTQRMWSPSDPPPAAISQYPEDVTLVVERDKSLRITVQGEGSVVMASEAGDISMSAASGDITLNVDAGKVYLGSTSSTEPVAKGTSLKAYLDSIVTVFNQHGHNYNSPGGAAITSQPQASLFPGVPPLNFSEPTDAILATTTEVK